MWFDSDHFRTLGSLPALIDDKQEVSYARLGARLVNYREALQRERFSFDGAVIAIDGRYSSDLCALWFALVKDGAIIVPLPPGPPSKRDEFTQIARVQASLSLDSAGVLTVRSEGGDGVHDLYDRLRERRAPGLVLFSSGTTGNPKASVLDFNRLLARYQGAKRPRRTLAFLSLDHIGGINTLMNTVFNGGAVITTDDRSPASVFRAVAAHRVDTLPTTPTFLTMSLISGELERHDLTSLRLVTYGTEPMPAQTLRKIHSVLPHVRLKQTYGLSEIGILPTVSRSNDSLWLKLGGVGFEHKIVNGILWIRSQMAMLGYLNAHAPFDEEGWFDTRDAVEVDGEYIRILGRASEIINVAGEKVYPNEVESVLLELDNVVEATAFGKPSPITGMVVKARLRLACPEPLADLRRRVREHCRERLEAFKIPASVEVDDELQHSARFKKLRVAS